MSEIYDLEDILSKCFGCKKPFLKKPKVVRVFKDGEKQYEYFTKAGGKAYEKLIDTVYGLKDLGVIDDDISIVTILDSIVSRDNY